MSLANDWHRYCFDAAVNAFGRIVENALQERENVGSQEKPQYMQKYTLQQLLSDGFALEDRAAAPSRDLTEFGHIDGFNVSEVR